MITPGKTIPSNYWLRRSDHESNVSKVPKTPYLAPGGHPGPAGLLPPPGSAPADERHRGPPHRPPPAGTGANLLSGPLLRHGAGGGPGGAHRHRIRCLEHRLRSPGQGAAAGAGLWPGPGGPLRRAGRVGGVLPPLGGELLDRRLPGQVRRLRPARGPGGPAGGDGVLRGPGVRDGGGRGAGRTRPLRRAPGGDSGEQRSRLRRPDGGIPLPGLRRPRREAHAFLPAHERAGLHRVLQLLHRGVQRQRGQPRLHAALHRGP